MEAKLDEILTNMVRKEDLDVVTKRMEGFENNQRRFDASQRELLRRVDRIEKERDKERTTLLGFVATELRAFSLFVPFLIRPI